MTGDTERPQIYRDDRVGPPLARAVIGRAPTGRYACHTYTLTPRGHGVDASFRLPVWLRDPRYTGVNRCLPCTVVNLVIAAVVAVAVAVASGVRGWGIAVLAVGVTTIAVRGYLVPGTPTLTKRYLPDRVLALFDKGPERAGVVLDDGDGAVDDNTTAGDTPAGGTSSNASSQFDLAARLLAAGVLVDGGFRERWIVRSRELANSGRETDANVLAGFLDIDADEVSLVDRGYAYVATIGGNPAGQWGSRSAFVADLAAADCLEGRWPEWSTMPTARRSELLGSLRLFVDSCPGCDGAVTLDTAVVESCCRQYDVLAATCEVCGSRLFEADIDPQALERAAA